MIEMLDQISAYRWWRKQRLIRRQRREALRRAMRYWAINGCVGVNAHGMRAVGVSKKERRLSWGG